MYMMIGKRSISLRIRVEPHTTSGTLTSRPMMTRPRWPLEAPAIASTLSSPINASATMIVRSALQNVLPALMSGPSSSP